MQANLNIESGLLENADKFTDPFFKRFKLRHAENPLRLTYEIEKDYMFPTFYSDVTVAMGIFMCSYKKAKALLPHPRIKPVKMTRGRSLVAFACYEYKNVMGVAPYNEIAMTIPIMVDPVVNVPVLPMVVDSFKDLGFGYYVFHMPVTSKENQLRGNNIWGLPKVTQRIDIEGRGGDCHTAAYDESGELYFELSVPTDGKPEKFDVSSYLYSCLGCDLLKSKTCYKATFNVTKHMDLLLAKNKKPDREYLKIHNVHASRDLLGLDIEEHPFQLRFARGMNACFDLPDKKYKAPVKF